MKKLTKNQRREIYLKALELIKDENCCCVAIDMARFGNEWFEKDSEKGDFPEFELFEPTQRGDIYWFGKTEIPENQQARIDALLFCIAMCE